MSTPGQALPAAVGIRGSLQMIGLCLSLGIVKSYLLYVVLRLQHSVECVHLSTTARNSELVGAHHLPF